MKGAAAGIPAISGCGAISSESATAPAFGGFLFPLRLQEKTRNGTRGHPDGRRQSETGQRDTAVG